MKTTFLIGAILCGAASAQIAYEDFESGNPQGWTINGNIPVDIVYNFNEFRIDKTGDEIILYYGTTFIDEFAWTSAWGLAPSVSLQLALQGFLEWGNDIEFNWCDSTLRISNSGGLYGTPGNENPNNYCSLAGQDNDPDVYS